MAAVNSAVQRNIRINVMASPSNSEQLPYGSVPPKDKQYLGKAGNEPYALFALYPQRCRAEIWQHACFSGATSRALR